MKGLSKFITLVTACLISQVQAEKIVVSLSQEQEGAVPDAPAFMFMRAKRSM